MEGWEVEAQEGEGVYIHMGDAQSSRIKHDIKVIPLQLKNPLFPSKFHLCSL